jgi:hypothetical protein
MGGTGKHGSRLRGAADKAGHFSFAFFSIELLVIICFYLFIIEGKRTFINEKIKSLQMINAFRLFQSNRTDTDRQTGTIIQHNKR